MHDKMFRIIHKGLKILRKCIYLVAILCVIYTGFSLVMTVNIHNEQINNLGFWVNTKLEHSDKTFRFLNKNLINLLKENCRIKRDMCDIKATLEIAPDADIDCSTLFDNCTRLAVEQNQELIDSLMRSEQ